jgi:hypothetical protein
MSIPLDVQFFTALLCFVLEFKLIYFIFCFDYSDFEFHLFPNNK